MKRLLTLILVLTGTVVLAFGQDVSKFSTGTQMIISARDGGITLQSPVLNQRRNIPSGTPGAVRSSADDFPYAVPFKLNGVQMVTCWISMTDQDYRSLERLGVRIQERFKGRVTAQVPVDNLEKVAELKNVTKISVARRLKKNTYRARVLTNVDDVLNLSNDAQTAGLLQAYDGTGVVLGVIDTGIEFNNQFFKDAQGNTRIKKAYVWDNYSETLKSYTGSEINSLTYDTSEEAHGTHTSSTAGGSNYTAAAYVYTTGTGYQKVNNAKFGGMAPGVDLVLCGLGEELTDVNIAACIKGISDYADEVGKPCIISISLGSHEGPHDGTGDMADVCAQYTGEGKIIVYAASNDGDMQYYHYKEATKADPAMTVLYSETRSGYYNNFDFGESVHYARTPNVQLAGRFYVVDTSKDSIVWVSQEITTSKALTVNTTGSYGGQLNKYYENYDSDTRLYGYLDKDPHSNKWCFTSYLYYLVPKESKYRIAVSVYPRYPNNTTIIDTWSVGYLSFEGATAVYNDETYTFTEGNALSSISNEATFPAIISIGAYCSSKYWYGESYWGSGGEREDWGTSSVYGGVCDFSSYQPEGYGPLGTKLPWITAPGEVVLAGYNSAYDSYNYMYAYGTNHVLGAMSGTSMSTPCAAGIIALWLQADPTLTPEDVKTVMKETAIHDNYTNGTQAPQFGNGKIDALGGIEYILRHMGALEPSIEATPAELTFEGFVDEPMTQTVTVSAKHLSGDITVTLEGDEVFSVDKTTISPENGKVEETLNVVWATSEPGETSATLTLSSPNAEDVVIDLSGTSVVGTPELIVEPSALEFATLQRDSQEQTFHVAGLHVREDVTLTLNDENGVFTLDKDVIQASELAGDNVVDVTVTYLSADAGEFAGTVTLQCSGVEDIVVSLNATTETVVPKVLVEPSELTFTAKLGMSRDLSFVVTGDHLVGDVTLALNDENGVFTLDKETILLDELTENGMEVTVSFLSDVEGTFEGTITLQSQDAEDVTVNLFAEAREGGMASDPWLNIAYYVTIDDASWNSNYVNQLYQYLETEDEEVAWLTLPVYGAWASVFYAPKAQSWISIGSKNSSSVRSWEANDVFAGSAAYFINETGTGAPRGFGTTSKTNKTNKYEVSFYVSNVTAVKLLGMGAAGNEDNYPAALKVYECNKEPDGTLSDGECVNEVICASTSTEEPFVITIDEGLEAEKIYRVEASSYRCFLYEIAFQRSFAQPLPTIPTSITQHPTPNIFTPEMWYTLQGVRLATRPTISGLYIHGGRIVRVK